MKHPHSMMSDLPPGRNYFFAPKYSYIISTSVILRKATGISYAMNFIQYILWIFANYAKHRQVILLLPMIIFEFCL